MNTTKKVAFIYCCVEYLQMPTPGHSLDNQRKYCADFANQQGFEVRQIYCDRPTDGKLLDRLELSKLINALYKCKQGERYVVLIDDKRRLGQDTKCFENLVQAIRETGSILAFISEQNSSG